MDVPLWIERITGGDLRLLARALSEIENRGPRKHSLLEALFPHMRKACTIGVTGAPGSGKSTVVDALAACFRKQHKRVAILAIDPTSPFTRGSILGDRIRMQSHEADDGVYIRSMATRGSLGGLAPAAADVLVALDAAGFEVILIETVGVGQAEVDVVQLASTVALLLNPSSGSDVQTMKAGIMEIADVFVINKADLAGADRLESELRAMLSLGPEEQEKEPPIVRTVATQGTGIEELATLLTTAPLSVERPADYWERRVIEMVRERLMDTVLEKALPAGRLSEAAQQIAARRLNPFSFADELTRGLLSDSLLNRPKAD